MKIDPSVKMNLINQMSPKKENIQNDKAFGDVLKEKLEGVNKLQIKADKANRDLITGEAQDIHSVMIATEEAKLALEMTVQVRNKVIEAYKEINRMQI
ncbi:MAG: flagellar hook-basal body complex protein FliE [Firmicutes bacterium]|nr:flagellar hook-basal body complex protein FliE [Bacillota bacterium]